MNSIAPVSRSLLFGSLTILAVSIGFWSVYAARTAGDGQVLDACCTEPEEHAAHEPAASAMDEVAESRENVRIPDALMLNQHGEEVRLYSDLIEGKQVIINFVYSTCTSVCPTLQSVFQGIQSQLGDRLGTEVNLISISVDPDTDTPERLESFASDYGADSGWSFLTGNIDNVNDVLRAFGVYARTKEEHTSMFVLGDEPSGRWMYTSGFVAPASVVAQLEALCAGN
jgi:protein SCO1/2